MLFVATVAIHLARKGCGGFRLFEAVERPSSRCALVFDVHLAPHDVAVLKMSGFVDGGIASGASHLEHQHRLFRPGAGLEKSLEGRRIDEHVVEHIVTRHAGDAGSIAHVQSTAQINPLTVIAWELKLPVLRKTRGIGLGGWSLRKDDW